MNLQDCIRDNSHWSSRGCKIQRATRVSKDPIFDFEYTVCAFLSHAGGRDCLILELWNSYRRLNLGPSAWVQSESYNTIRGTCRIPQLCGLEYRTRRWFQAFITLNISNKDTKIFIISSPLLFSSPYFCSALLHCICHKMHSYRFDNVKRRKINLSIHFWI